MNKQFVKKRELAELLGCSTRTVDRMRAAGCKLGEVRIGKMVRFDVGRIVALKPLSA